MTVVSSDLAKLSSPLPNRTEDARFVTPRKVGVLLSNLGTPDATDYWSMRRYLAEFLWDRRVIEVPRLQWFFILNGLILAAAWGMMVASPPPRKVAKRQPTEFDSMAIRGCAALACR